MKPMLVIFNPAAGRGRGLATMPQVEAALRQAGLEFEVAATRAPLEAMKIASQAPPHYSTVVCVGGDGTIHEIVNGLLRASGEEETIPIGLVPLGTGDDFVKMLPPETPIGRRPFDWRAAVGKIARGQTQLFDVGRIVGDGSLPGSGNGPQYLINSMDLGFGALASLNLATIPKVFKGSFAYLAAVIKTMLNYPCLHMQLSLDDQLPFHQSSTLTAIMNGRCFGNGYWVCPDARADDGWLDLMVAQEVSRWTILRMIPKLMRGAHTGEPILRMYRARKVVIESQEPLVVEVDGETPFIAARHLEVEMLPKRLRLLV